MVVSLGNESTKVCGVGKIQCYRDAHYRLFQTDLVDGLSTEEGKFFRNSCNCLPACTMISYETEIIRTKLDWKFSLRRIAEAVAGEEIKR